ncbi:cytochrome P450 [Amylostereum chailletii]|nr:cytochrome P450 [Amylostereum chailletii]
MGHTFHALQGENSAFAVALKDYFPAWSRVQVESRWLPTLTALFPRALLRFLADHAPWADVRRLAQISDTLYAVTKEIWEAKKARTDADTLGEESDEGRDLMSILLKANDAANEEDRLPDDELLAQMSTFLFAGTDTTSSALARILHMLCLHPDAQEELREELVAAGGAHGALDYDALHGLSYLDAVCRETLRLFPPVSVVQRIAQTDTLLPLSAPILGTDNRPHTTLAIPNRTGFVLNVLGVNRDPDIWGDDADEWKPERWRTGPLPESVGRARVPGVYANQMTFISGPRACIGFQFALLEMKIVLAQLIPPFRFFLPTQKDIIWRCGAIVTPVVAGAEGEEREKPAMPLRVSLA